MGLNAKLLLQALAFAIIVSEGKIRVSSEFLLGIGKFLMDVLFVKEPNLTKVRRMENAKYIKGVAVLDFIGLVMQHGYPAEEHHVTTEDGYNLIIHRIPGNSLTDNAEKKKIVFLQHGLMGSSDCWVLFGPGKDLAFLLADEGYDVWVGNMRGNTYCRSHINLTTYDRKFWEYSFHETGMYDLPAAIDYILKYTGQESIRYIGHSMGAGSLMVLLSMRPEYNRRIKGHVLLAPAVFFKELSPLYRVIITPQLKALLDKYELYDIAAQSAMSVSLGREWCSDKAITQPLCAALLFVMMGSDPLQLNTVSYKPKRTALPLIMSHSPAGAAIQIFHHFYQLLITQKFQSYDYGAVGNYERYKQQTPIVYNLSKVSAPAILFYAPNDGVVHTSSVLKLSRYLPNVIMTEEIPHKFFNHIDILWAIDAKALLYDRIIQVLRKFDFNRPVSLY